MTCTCDKEKLDKAKLLIQGGKYKSARPSGSGPIHSTEDGSYLCTLDSFGFRSELPGECGHCYQVYMDKANGIDRTPIDTPVALKGFSNLNSPGQIVITEVQAERLIKFLQKALETKASASLADHTDTNRFVIKVIQPEWDIKVQDAVTGELEHIIDYTNY